MIDGKELMRRRKAKNLSQESLANMVGVTRNAVNRMEAETKDPSLATAAMLADALGCMIDDLILPSHRAKKARKDIPAS